MYNNIVDILITYFVTWQIIILHILLKVIHNFHSFFASWKESASDVSNFKYINYIFRNMVSYKL